MAGTLSFMLVMFIPFLGLVGIVGLWFTPLCPPHDGHSLVDQIWQD
jgi:hypothetical protein